MGVPFTDTGMSLIGFFAGQDSLKEIATSAIPGTADAMYLIGASASPSGETGVPRSARLGTATKVGDIPQQRGWEGSLEFELTPGGALLTAPDWAVLMENAGFERLTGPAATTVAGTSSTTTRVDLTSSAGLSAGMWLSTVISGVTYRRRITEVDSVGTDVVVSPAFPAAPAVNGVAVSFGLTWKLKDEATCDGDSITAWIFNDVTMDRWIGFVPNTVTFTGGGSQEVRVTMSGPIYRRDIITATTLDGSITNVATSIDVINVTAVPADVASGTKVRMRLADGTNEEVIDVTASNGDGTLTVTRNVLSAGAFAFADGVALLPYHPAPTVGAEDPLPGTLGGVSIYDEGEESAIAASAWTVEINRNLNQRTGVFGSAYMLDAVTEGMRDANVTISGWAYTTTTLRAMSQGIARESLPTIITAGSVEGRVALLELPAVKFNEPSIDRGADDIALELSGHGLGTVTGEDEFFLAAM